MIKKIFLLSSMLMSLIVISIIPANAQVFKGTALDEISTKNPKDIIRIKASRDLNLGDGVVVEKNSIIVNLHNWNGESCISSQAYAEAKCMNVRLLTMKAFYGYINEIMSTEQ